MFSSDLKKRDVVLQDDSTGANSVTLTLWGELAENFNYHNRVITIKGAKVIYFLLQVRDTLRGVILVYL